MFEEQTGSDGADGITGAQRQRALGAVVAAAAGDALGAPYEFKPPIAASDDVAMTGGGILDWGPGEWTDDTSMSIVVLEAMASTPPTHDLRLPSALDQVAREWYSWSIGTPDIGTLTSLVVRRATDAALAAGRTVPRGDDFAAAARAAHDEMPQNAGNGALMRTHVVALAYLNRPDEELREAVLALTRLTHRGADVEDASVLWTFAVRHAILTGLLDVRVGLDQIAPERRTVWIERIEEAETAPPSAFPRNGWVVHAFQGAWAAIHGVSPIPEGKFAQRAAMTAALESAVRAGYDTDTVAAIAGSLLGAALGHKAVQPEWRRVMFGWPGYEVSELVGLVERVLDVEDDPRPATGTGSGDPPGSGAAVLGALVPGVAGSVAAN